MKSLSTRMLTVIAVLVLATSLLFVAGCKKAPKLTQQQLMGVIASGQLPQNHPLSMADAQAQGCKCHLQ